MTLKIKLFICVALIALTVLLVLNRHREHAVKIKNETVIVKVAPVTIKDIQQTISQVGTVQPYASIAVKSQVDGTVTHVSFREGSDVQANEILFQIDSRPFDIELQQAKADLAKDQAQLDNAKLQFERYSNLIKTGAVSKDDYHQKRSNVAALEATVLADQAKVAAAQLKLDYATIRAPISGRTGNVVLQPGNLVKANDSNPLVVINQIQPIYVNFAIPEQFLPHIQQMFAKGPIKLSALLGENKQWVEQGELSSMNNAIDTATGTIQMKATFANTHRLLWPGQFVTLIMPVAKFTQARVVPSQAIQQGQQGSYVYVVTSAKKAQFRLVKIGVAAGGETIVLDGLKPGEQVVIEGQFRLVDGASVEIK